MNRAGGIFVTGTDTEVGKTLVSAGMLRAMRARGRMVAGYKPVAAGCEWGGEGWRNEDALSLAAAAGLDVPYAMVNPVALPAAIAPHLAAEDHGVELTLPPLIEGFQVLSRHADWVLTEGAGGWRVPINERHTLADLAVALSLPVVLVVDIRLGCINHALLTAQAVAADGLTLAGWVANRVGDDVNAGRQVESIARRLPTPLLGRIPELADAEPRTVAGYLDLSPLA